MLKKVLLMAALAVVAFSQIGRCDDATETYARQLEAVEQNMCDSDAFMDMMMSGPFAEFTARLLYRTDLRTFLGEDMNEDMFVENMKKEMEAQRPDKAEPFVACELESEIKACEDTYKDIAGAGGPLGITESDGVTVDDVAAVFGKLGITDCAVVHGVAQVEGEDKPMSGTFYLGVVNRQLSIFYMVTEKPEEKTGGEQ